MNTAARTLRNTAQSTLASWTEFFLGMVVSIIVARSLQPELYGHFSFMMWCATVFVIVSNGGLSTGVIKFLAEDERAPIRRAVHDYMKVAQRRFLLVTSLLSLLAGLAFSEFFRQTAILPLWLLLLAASSVKAAYIFKVSASKGREHFGTIARVVLIVAPFNLLANALVAWAAPSLAAFLAVYLCTSLAYLACMRLFETREQGDAVLSDTHRQRVRHHLWVTGASIILSFLILRQSEVFFLRLFDTPENIGFFNIAFTIGFALSALIPGVYSALLLPMMSRESRLDNDTRAERYRTSLRYVQLLAWPMAFATYALGEPLILTLYGEAFAPSARVLTWVVTGTAVAALSQAGVSLLVSGDRQTQVLISNVLVTVLVLLIDWWAILHWGLLGAGVAFVAGNLLHAGLMLTLAGRHTRARWPWGATLRTLAAGALAWVLTDLCLWALAPLLGPMGLLLVGALVFSLGYAGATFLTGCWESDDIAFMVGMSERLPSPLGRPLHFLLSRLR